MENKPQQPKQPVQPQQKRKPPQTPEEKALANRIVKAIQQKRLQKEKELLSQEEE